MNLRRLSVLAVAGLLTLAACGDPDNPPAAQAPAQQRTLEDVTSKLPAEWPATQAMREADGLRSVREPVVPNAGARDVRGSLPQPSAPRPQALLTARR